MHYIFGYGSLIHIPFGQESLHVGYARLYAGSSALSIRRAWNAHSTCRQTGQKYTAVGLEWTLPSKARPVNGRIFMCTTEELAELREREKEYDSIGLPACLFEFLTPLGSPLPPDTYILSFIPRNPQRPTEEYPINSSYLNTCVDACAVVNPEFAEEFLRETTHAD